MRGVKIGEFRELKGGHLKGQVLGDRPIDFIAFGMAENQALLTKPVDMLVTPEINEWAGKRTLQLRIKELIQAVF